MTASCHVLRTAPNRWREYAGGYRPLNASFSRENNPCCPGRLHPPGDDPRTPGRKNNPATDR